MYKWEVPDGHVQPQLRVLNSFTRQKEVFQSKEPRRVAWYACGPTVYDSAHMGHARAYITFDILRRIMRDYFNYDTLYVMNITDIDDKIIKRARQKYLIKLWKSESPTRESLLSDVSSCLKKVLADLKGETDPEAIYKLNMLKEQLERVNSSMSPADILDTAFDALADLIDKRRGHEVNDSSIFTELPRYYECDYFEDMRNLNVEPPDVLTRVSEYVPEIVDYVRVIIGKGFAYEANGSVYFDVVKFSQSPDHFYAKLLPEALGDEKKLKEGEGALSDCPQQVGEKRSPRDFALWKSSKPGEPAWNSPWGKGRPGWHIECSVMASDILGESIDIHCGGVDLKFPHHDNEIAQAEAYYGNNDWIRYFLHSGHLKIDGLKMSKSLKNFISIKDALKSYTSVQIRILFLLHEWSSTLDFGYETMKEAMSFEKTMREFFLAVKNILRSASPSYQKLKNEDKELIRTVNSAKSDIHAALCDSFNTPRAMGTIRNLISQINTYISTCKEPDQLTLRNTAVYLTHIFKVFGLIRGDESIGFPVGDAGSANAEQILLPFLNEFAAFRESARQSAFAMLQACDALRDENLPKLGVRLEDKTGQPPVIKYVGVEAIEQEKKQAEELATKKAAEKENMKKRQAEAAAQKDAQRRINPATMFKSESDKYSQFDDKGIPTHNADGSEISAKLRKKLVNQQDKQRELYNQYLKEAGDS